MSKEKLRTASIAAMLLLTGHAFWTLFNYYQHKLSIVSPLIPDHVIDQIVGPFPTHVIFAVLAAIVGMPFFLRSKYYATIGICVAALVIEFVLVDIIGLY